MLKDILIYLLIVAVLRGLVHQGKYVEYFQFFSGMILILILVTPLLSNFGNSSEWFQNLEEKIFEMDRKEMESCMDTAEGSLQKSIKREYEKELEKQVKVLAQNQGMDLKEADVIVTFSKDGWKISEISATAKGEKGSQEEEEREVEAVYIPKIQWNGEEGKERSKKQAKEVTSGKSQSVKKQICRYFSIEKEQVHIWE